MTIVVTVKVSDGIVMAADSAASFYAPKEARPTKIYNNAIKIFNLVKVWPIGALTFGAGSIGPLSISTLSKDLRASLTPQPGAANPLNAETYTIEEVVHRAKSFFYDEKFHEAHATTKPPDDFFFGYRIGGYSAGAALPELWEFSIAGDGCHGPKCILPQNESGVRWAGENEPLDRLILGASGRLVETFKSAGLTQEQAHQSYLAVVRNCGAHLSLPAMPIQDAIDLATFLAETAVSYMRFAIGPETVGGPIEVAAITKHEGYKWVTRKHYYRVELNREG